LKFQEVEQGSPQVLNCCGLVPGRITRWHKAARNFNFISISFRAVEFTRSSETELVLPSARQGIPELQGTAAELISNAQQPTPCYPGHYPIIVL
jgi:hypothetical protein